MTLLTHTTMQHNISNGVAIDKGERERERGNGIGRITQYINGVENNSILCTYLLNKTYVIFIDYMNSARDNTTQFILVTAVWLELVNC